jgi:Flp pilus assembly pilin Flp
LASLFALTRARVLRTLASIRDEDGQGLTEYAFLLVGIVAVVGVVVALITTGLQNEISGIFP